MTTTSAAGALARLQAARAWLHAADPIIAGLIDRRPDYDSRHRLDGIPPMDLFGALVFQVTGQQLSVASRRRIAERWRPFRSLATLYLFRAGESTAAVNGSVPRLDDAKKSVTEGGSPATISAHPGPHSNG